MKQGIESITDTVLTGHPMVQELVEVNTRLMGEKALLELLRSDLFKGDCFDLFWLKQTSLFHSLIAYNFQLLLPLISEYLTSKYQSPPSQYHLAND